jgi:hypothetical protein
MPKVSKRTQVAAARKEYTKLDRAYHAVGKKAFGKPKKSTVHKDYETIKRARNAAGRKLGKLTGIRK